jgi:hypothetical protein
MIKCVILIPRRGGTGWSWRINYAVKFWHHAPCNYGNQFSHNKIKSYVVELWRPTLRAKRMLPQGNFHLATLPQLNAWRQGWGRSRSERNNG